MHYHVRVLYLCMMLSELYVSANLRVCVHVSMCAYIPACMHAYIDAKCMYLCICNHVYSFGECGYEQRTFARKS